MRSTRLALAQINTTVGAIDANCDRIRAAITAAREAGARLVAFPELAVTGYPPEDLLMRRSFCHASRDAIEGLASDTVGLVAVVGFVDWEDGQPYNGAAVLADGKWVATYHKHRLPNYGVFDEQRYFAAGDRVLVIRTPDLVFGVCVCEDVWYPGQPLEDMALAGADLCLNINASPYHRGKAEDRERMLSTRAADYRIALAYVNQVGGQDELVFDGCSLVFDPGGIVRARAPQFEEMLLIADVDLDAVGQHRLHDPRLRYELSVIEPPEVDVVDIDLPVTMAAQPQASQIEPLGSDEQQVWNALVLGTRDYVRKTGFERVLIAISGGIDSALVAALAVDALGPENVLGVSMPSRYSSEHSQTDAAQLAQNLGIEMHTVPIEPAHAAMEEMLGGFLPAEGISMGEENMQSRQRANVMMTLSNNLAALVLTTGNKSEMATGYATLYGDMAGAYAVVKDVSKTLLYQLSLWRNAQAGFDLIPNNTIQKPPSAELRPGQEDEDSLPPYAVLDPILELYVEEDRTPEEIIALGFNETVVREIIRMVDRNEFKRRQAAPGVKITPRAFGRDRRLPLASGWRPA